ncbi:MAG: 16S rRNA (guanine(966)-N(2))-methyltransferase RsmD [Prochlorococcaceae cyanobacterium]
MTLRLSGGRRLQSPPGSTARPTASRVRLAVMNLLAAELPNCHWLDLCCGSGLMGCEALQRGAQAVLAVERDRRIAAVARSNLEAVARGLVAGGGCAPARVDVVQQEVLRFLAGGAAGQSYGLIYVDPPYEAGLHAPVADAVAQGGWLAPQGTLVWECGSSWVPDLPSGWWLRDKRRYASTTVLLLEQN